MFYEEVEIIWKNIKSEINILVKEEPYLFDFYDFYLLQHNHFIQSISYILSNQLFDTCISFQNMNKIILQSYLKNPIMARYAIQDIKMILKHDPVVNLFSTPLLYFKGFHALQAYRIGHYLWLQGRKSLAIYLQHQISKKFSIDIHPAANIGSGIILDHGTGIVIGETVIIENNVSILQSVTIGSRYNIRGNRHPIIREGTMIGAGAKILGNIEVGAFVKIGAGSVVLNSIPDYATVVGIPAKIINICHSKLKNNINKQSCINDIDKFNNGDGI